MLERLAAALGDRYRVEREIGAGGMAVVYLAHDLRHDRPVAIKLLRPELSAVLGSERFLQEIRTVAHLQHPHILALYDSGSADGLLYYVMPWVAGESLRHRLNRERQLPVGDALRIAREVADALDYAHRQGLIHRDIKPENILLHDGRALVADFGIALAVRNAGGARLTGTGLSLGTPQYMSPEQVTAEREVDARSDVYSLGCVLYEMLAGEPPYTGPTMQSVVARILTDRPRMITELRDTVPPHVAAALHTSLAKLPADRFNSASQFAEALMRPEASPAWPTGAGSAVRARHWPRTRFLAAVAILALPVFAVGWQLGLRSSAPAAGSFRPSRLSIPTPGLSQSGSDLRHRSIALLSDGSAVIYAVAQGDKRLLMLHRLVDLEGEPIQDGAPLYAPDVSPDGEWLFGRTWEGSGRRRPLQAGPAGAVEFTGGITFGAWHPDGTLWLTRPPYQAIERVPGAGADSAEIRFSGFNGIRLQQILDNGRTAVALEVERGATAGTCVTIDLETGRIRPLIEGPIVQARYTAGYLVYARPDGVLLAAPFDEAAGQLRGPAVAIATGIVLAGVGEAQFAVAANGTVAYVPVEPSTLVLVDRAGNARLATEERRNFHAPRFAPDGRRISLDFSTSEGRDVWVLDLDQSILTRATFERDGFDASWMPDGRSLTYQSYRSGSVALFRIRPGGGTPADSLFVSTNFTQSHWLPDGSGFLTSVEGDIVIVRQGGRGPMERLVATRFTEGAPTLSPDGVWLAFVSDQTGQREVFVRRLDGQGELIQVSRAGGTEPVWGPDGRELFYRGPAGVSEELVVASLDARAALRVMSRTTLFSVAEFSAALPHANYDVSPDGRSFAFVRRSPSTRIVVIQNLPALVRGERRP